MFARTGGTSCYGEGKVCKLIAASIALHNICVTKEIPLTVEDENFRDQVIIPEEAQGAEVAAEYRPGQILALGKTKRNDLAQTLGTTKLLGVSANISQCSKP